MIEIYSLKIGEKNGVDIGCPKCEQLKTELLKTGGIEYEYHSLSMPDIVEIAKKYNCQSAPIVVKDGFVILGSDAKEIVERLKEK